MSKNQQYAMKYAEYAMEQMRRYGIPASVTLAQGILESIRKRIDNMAFVNFTAVKVVFF